MFTRKEYATSVSGKTANGSACQKSLFDTLRQFFKLLKNLKNWLIERERHP